MCRWVTELDLASGGTFPLSLSVATSLSRALRQLICARSRAQVYSLVSWEARQMDFTKLNEGEKEVYMNVTGLIKYIWSLNVSRYTKSYWLKTNSVSLLTTKLSPAFKIHKTHERFFNHSFWRCRLGGFLMRCEQNEKHGQNDNLLQELVEILRIKNVNGYQTKNVVLFKNSRYVCLPAKA